MADPVKVSIDDLVKGCLRKDGKSQELLYKQFFGYALSVAMIYNNKREEAIEVVNDSFIKVFSGIGKYERELPFRGWLRKIVINTSIDRFRKKHKNYGFIDDEVLHIPDENPTVISHLTTQDILFMLNSLPEIQRMVFQLYEIEGYGHDKIAEMLEIGESSSRVYLTRAKKRLRELFALHFNTNYEKIRY